MHCGGNRHYQHPSVPDLWQSRQISASKSFALVIPAATYLAPKRCWSNYIEVIHIAWQSFGSSSVISFRIRRRERSAEDQHHGSVCSAAVVFRTLFGRTV